VYNTDVLEVESITDVGSLKSTVVELEKAVRSLTRQNLELQREILQLKGLDPQQISLLFQLEVPPPSDAAEGPSADGDHEPESNHEDTKDEKPRPRRKSGRTPQAKLPVARVDVPLESKTCPDCDLPVISFDSWDTSEMITVTRAEYSLVSERRQKGRCGCPDKVHVAPTTILKMRSGGRYSVQLTAHVAVNKWCDHLPLERQARRMARSGVEVTPQALFDQTSAMADELRPVYDELINELLGSDVLGIDETSWRLLQKGGSEYRAAIGLSTPTGSGYLFSEGKGTDVMEQLLEPFSGTLVCDGLKVYSCLAERREASGAGPMTLANCWAHVMRRFRDAAKDFPVAEKMMALIGELYDIDRRAGPFPGDDEVRRRRAKARSKESTAVLARIRRLALKLRDMPKPLSVQEAAAYLLGHWSGLTVFVKNPDVSLDNNGCERDLRQLVQGRKNHYGSGSDRGLMTSAVLYSLIQTCLKVGVDPEVYLVEAIRRRRQDPAEIYLPRHAAAEVAQP